MDFSETTTNNSNNNNNNIIMAGDPSNSISPSSPTSSSPTGSPSSTPSSSPQVILSPCAACKILRRRCVEKCVLAPYFPPTEPMKFTIAHKVFGASNIIKMLQELPESHRTDAVNSLVYEANARIRDPVYGCAGAISQLQKQVSDLQAELAKAQAQIFNFQSQNSNLLSLFSCMHHQQEITTPQILNNPQEEDHNLITTFFLDDDDDFGNNDLAPSWEPLWA